MDLTSSAPETKNLRAVITRHGGPEVLALCEEPLPTPGRRQVRVAVRAAGVGFFDVYARRGTYPTLPRPPFTPGFDLVGVVDAVGSLVRDVRVGERVGAIIERGASARYVCVDADRVLPIPEAVPDHVSVAALLNYVTALQMLVRVGRVRAGQAVFVHALAGGVGTAVLDLAPLLGLRVFGTASAAKHAFVRAHGGQPIDYRSEDFVRAALALEPAGFAVVLDGIGSASLKRSHQLLARGGTLVSFGFLGVTGAGRFAVLPTWLSAAWLALLPGRRTRLYGAMEFNYCVRRLREDVAWIMDKLARAELSPSIAAVLPLREIGRAHALLESGQTQGKLVLSVAADGPS